ncbi:BatD family protein [Vibrio atypicus]|uniref:BatD family protein n=1 Tax=Vibrio atypicus TaxID=558271 RepID=UPI00135BCF69|nr:BatD family protein [Vibrio atypicus]
MMKRYKFYIVSLVAMMLVAISPATFAANLWVTVSKNKVVKNEVFQLRIVADEKVSSDDLDLKILENDFYVGRPSFGTSLNIINGKRTTRSEWNVSLAAQRLGNAEIPAFSLNGASSEPITIQVSVDADEPKVADLIELQNSLDKQQLYPNESAILKTRLIIKADPRRLQNPNILPPRAEGLTLDAIGEPNQYQSVLDGVEVTMLEQDYRVTADKAGNFTLWGIGFKGSVVYGSNRTGTTKLVSANTAPEQFAIKVNPIPDNYQGNWLPASSLSLSQRWSDSDGNAINNDTLETKVGDSISREITLDIQGVTSERFPDIKIDYPKSVRVYQEKPQFSQLANGSTRMTLTQVIIPQQQGDITLNDVQINWWNSQKEKQVSSNIEGITLNVNPGDLVNNTEPALLNTPIPAAETVVVKDSGFWPYLTALFAALWLISTVLLVKRKKPSVQSPTINSSEQEGTVALIHAIESGDSVRAGYLAKEWILQTNIPDKALKMQIDTQLQAMQASRYSTKALNWDSGQLISLIKQADRHSRKSNSCEEPLAKL